MTLGHLCDANIDCTLTQGQMTQQKDVLCAKVTL